MAFILSPLVSNKNILCPEVPISISPLLRSSIVAILGAIGTPLERYIGMVVKLSVARSYICSPFKDPMKKRPFYLRTMYVHSHLVESEDYLSHFYKQ